MTLKPLTVPQELLPNGEFLLPICVNKQGVQDMLDAMLYARGLFSSDGSDLEYMYPLLESLAFVSTPGNAPCVAATPEDGFCTDYSTSTAMLSFAPQDPRVNPEFVPEGYNLAPFYFQPGTTRIVTSIERIPNLLDGVPDVGFPRFRLTFTGEGVVELHLVSVVQGGLAIITLDDNPLSALVVDTNRDLTSIPPETSDQLTCEVVVSGTGAHHIDCTFVPQFNDEAIPIRFGGGLEKVVLCGEDIHGDTTMPEFQLRRKPATNDYTLQIKIGAGDWLDTEYSFKGQPINLTSITQDVIDENGAVVGTFTPLNSGINPSTQISNTNYSLELSREAFKGNDGKDGKDGNDGIDGHNNRLLDPPLQEVLNPNEDPDIVVDDALPSTTFMGFKLPRAPEFSFEEPIDLPPGSVNEIVFSKDTNGDWIGQQYRSQGLPGSSGGSFGDIDVDPPGEGESKSYPITVLADSGSALTFTVPAGSSITGIQTRGLWLLVDTIGTAKEQVLGADGVPHAGYDTNDGMLMIGAKLPTDNTFTYYPYNALPLDFDQDTEIKFAQNRNGTGQYGAGYIPILVTIERAAPAVIEEVTDFRDGQHHGWQARISENAIGNEFGGELVQTGGTAYQGWIPTIAYGGFVKETCIASPLLGDDITVTRVKMYFDQMDGTSAYHLWKYHNNSGWHDLTPLFEIGASDGSKEYELPTPIVCDQLACAISNYAHDATTWRFYKCEVTTQ